jgi:hypothetical protein
MATIGKEHYGVENYAHHAAWYNALGAPDMPAFGAMPPAMPAPNPKRGLAKGGHVDDDETVVVGEEGPEVFVPDRPGTVVPHMPQPARKPAVHIVGLDYQPRIIPADMAARAKCRARPARRRIQSRLDGHDRQRPIAAQCGQLAPNDY